MQTLPSYFFIRSGAFAGGTPSNSSNLGGNSVSIVILSVVGLIIHQIILLCFSFRIARHLLGALRLTLVNPPMVAAMGQHMRQEVVPHNDHRPLVQRGHELIPLVTIAVQMALASQTSSNRPLSNINNPQTIYPEAILLMLVATMVSLTMRIFLNSSNNQQINDPQVLDMPDHPTSISTIVATMAYQHTLVRRFKLMVCFPVPRTHRRIIKRMHTIRTIRTFPWPLRSNSSNSDRCPPMQHQTMVQMFCMRRRRMLHRARKIRNQYLCSSISSNNFTSSNKLKCRHNSSNNKRSNSNSNSKDPNHLQQLQSYAKH